MFGTDESCLALMNQTLILSVICLLLLIGKGKSVSTSPSSMKYKSIRTIIYEQSIGAATALKSRK